MVGARRKIFEIGTIVAAGVSYFRGLILIIDTTIN